MTDQTLADTTVTETETQAAKTYTQEEVDNMMAGLKSSVSKRAVKPYAELGDPEELRRIKSEWEAHQQEQAIARGEFETTLATVVSKKDAEIERLNNAVKSYKLDSPLLDAAARYKSVNPQQVQALLRSAVSLDEEGNPIVIDNAGKTRRGDDGKLLSVDDLVREFLDSNPHFVAATPSTTHTTSSRETSGDAFDINSLDMKNPKHRQKYQEARRAGLV